MTSVLASPGKYRSRNEWSTSSIPQLVEEENSSKPLKLATDNLTLTTQCQLLSTSTPNINNTEIPPIRPERRGSQSINILSWKNNNEKGGKRRSSFAVALLRQRQSTTKTDFIPSTDICQINSRESDVENNPSILLTIPNDYDNEKKKRRSSWQAKLDRRKRKQGFVSVVDSDNNLKNDIPLASEFNYGRQKRHSWWTIFVPENLKSR